MTAVEGIVKARQSLPARIASRTGGGVLRVFLVLVGLFWLMPTVGLLLSSVRSPSDIASTGWWKTFTDPSRFTFHNYASLLDNSTITNSLLSTVAITVPATVLVVGTARSPVTRSPGWTSGPRLVVLMVWVSLLVVPVQVALVPGRQALRQIGSSRRRSGVIIFHVAFGLPFAIFLLRNFFAENPEGAPRGGPPRRRGRDPALHPRGECRSAARLIASLGIFQFLWVWNDMLVALDLRGLQAPADHGWPCSSRSASSATTSTCSRRAPSSRWSSRSPIFFAFQRQFVSGGDGPARSSKRTCSELDHPIERSWPGRSHDTTSSA
ncbi:sugar ABC transporter permease [Streptomyces violascens]|uniref:Sugar ABC transporter permease n=1 Tax=Streptomyces violascens TaxID=67381 RepID=A0ABQ3QMP0_9ACTN|nr:sugar ABC transporter permease [Streptomyces violascens]